MYLVIERNDLNLLLFLDNNDMYLVVKLALDIEVAVYNNIVSYFDIEIQLDYYTQELCFSLNLNVR